MLNSTKRLVWAVTTTLAILLLFAVITAARAWDVLLTVSAVGALLSLHLIGWVALQHRQAMKFSNKLQRAEVEISRLSKRASTIDNTARSVGRAAPLIREVHRDVKSLAQVRTDRTPASLTAQVKDTPVLQPSYSFATARPSSSHKTFPEFRVLMVADEFTIESFRDEWKVDTPTPQNWKNQLNGHSYDLLFVESAWNGNDGSWLYHLVGPSAPRPAVLELVEECKAQGIPTLFWNKEDPPHFRDFLSTARLFDWVATTDGSLLDDYRRELGHDRVFCLPFAAQPRLHNPIRDSTKSKRTREIVFGGMYFAKKYPERRKQMDLLLPAAAKIGLDIYTRHADSPDYKFPAHLASFVRGSLPYRQMITAYKEYKVVVNVNSVVDSPTMCARRIFEASACGAAVVTTATPALERYFPNNEVTVVDEDTTYDSMRVLVKSNETRERLVHRAQRQIWREHTYAHRAAQVMRTLERPVDMRRISPTVSVICPTARPDQMETILSNFSRQEYGEKQLVIATHGFYVDPRYLWAQAQRHGVVEPPILVPVDESASLGDVLRRLVLSADGDFIARMDDDDFYGSHYLEDVVRAQHYSGADLVGKEASYLYFESAGATYLSYAHREHSWTKFVRGATFAGPARTFRDVEFGALGIGEDSDFLQRLHRNGGKVYSADRFNFVAHRGANKNTHTWAAPDLHLAATGVMVCVGNGREHVSV